MKQKGFTLTEIIIVIIILGILAAYAVPKYYAMDDEARKTVTIALAKNLKSAAYMVHGIASMQGKTRGIDEVDIGKGRKIQTMHGYPAPSETGISAAIHDIESNFEVTTIFTKDAKGNEQATGNFFIAKGRPFTNTMEEFAKESSKLNSKQRKELNSLLTPDEQLEYLGIKSCGVIYNIVYRSKTQTKTTEQVELFVKPLFDGC